MSEEYVNIDDDEYILDEDSSQESSDEEPSEQWKPDELLIQPANSSRSLIFKPEPETLKDDLERIPLCAEKFILSLIWNISSTLENFQRSSSKSFTELNQNISVIIERDHKQLKECLAREYSSEELNSAGFKECMKEIEDAISKASGSANSFYEWRSLIDKYKYNLLKLLRPLDIENLFRLIEETDKSAAIIEGRDIILLLGKTGAGKSTTAHYLAGTKLVAGSNGVVVDESEILANGLEKVTISSGSNSETRFISPVKIDATTIVRRTAIYFACDTPGFDDTAGAEVDIANTYGMIQAIHKCKSVRPVAVLNYDGVGGRMDGPIELANLLSRMMPDSEKIFDSMGYVFTKFPENVNPHLILKEAYERKGLKESSKPYILHMIEKTENFSFKINPLDADAREQANKLLREIARTVAIEYPSEHFKYFITEQSKSQLKNQLGIHEKTIENAIKRQDYELVDYKLGQLKKLKECLSKMHSIDADLETVTKKLKEKFDQVYQESITKIQNQIQNQNKLTDNDVNDFKDAIAMFTKVRPLISKYLDNSNELDYVRLLERHLVETSSEISEQIINSIEKEGRTINSCENVKILSENFPATVNPTFQALFEKLVQELNRSTLEFKAIQEPIDFKTTAKKLTLIRRLELHATKIARDAKITDSSVKICLTLKDCCDFLMSLLNDSFSKRIDLSRKWDDNFIEDVNSCINNIDSTIISLSQFLEKSNLEKVRSLIYSKLKVEFQNRADRIEEILNQQIEKDTFQNIKPLFDDITMLRKVTEFANQTSDSYYRVTSFITDKVEGFNRRVAEAFKNFEIGRSDENFENINLFFQTMKNSEWLNQIKRDLCSTALKRYERDLIEQINDLHDNILDTNLDVKNYANLDQTIKNYLQIYRLRIFRENSDKIKELIDSAEKSFTSKVQATFKTMEMAFNSRDKTLEFIKSKLESLKSQHASQGEVKSTSQDALSQEIYELENSISHMKLTGYDYHFPRLNGSFFEGAINYLNCFENKRGVYQRAQREARDPLSKLKTDATTIKKELKAYLNSYYLFVDNEFKNCLIFEGQGQHDEAKLKAQVSILINHLRDMELLKNQSKLLYDELNAETHLDNMNIIEHLNSLIDELAVQMDLQLKKFREDGDPKFTVYLEFTQILRFLDPYRTQSRSTTLAREFSAIYNECSNEKFKDVQQMVKNIENFLPSNNFREIASVLNQLEGMAISANSLRHMSHAISMSIESLIDSSKSFERKITKDFELTQVIKLSENLESLTKAQKELYSLLDSEKPDSNISKTLKSDSKKQIGLTLEAIKKSLTNKMSSFLDGINNSIQNSDFQTAEIGRDKYDQIYPYLSDFVVTGDEASSEGEQRTDSNSTSLRAKFAKIERAFEEDLEKTIQDYAQMPVVEYETKRPKILIEKLMKAPTQKLKYKEAIEKINDSIRQNVQRYMIGKNPVIYERKVSNSDSPSKAAVTSSILVNKKDRIEYVKSIIWYLPTSVATDITSEIARLEGDLKVKETKTEENIDRCLAQDDIDRINLLLDSNASYDNVIHQIHSKINNRVQEISLQVANDIKYTTNLDTVVSSSILLSRYLESFGKQNNEIQWDVKKVKEALKRKYESLNIDQIRISDVSMLDSEKAEVERRLSDFLAIVNLANEAPKMVDVEPAVLNKQLKSICSFFQENFQTFSVGLESFDARMVKEALMVSQQWTNLFQIFSQASQRDVGLESASYNNMIKLMNVRLTDFLTEIKALNFDDASVMKYEDKRNEIYQGIKRKLAFFKSLESLSVTVYLFQDNLNKANLEIRDTLTNRQADTGQKLMSIIDPGRIANEDFNSLRFYFDNLTSFDTLGLEGPECGMRKIQIVELRLNDHIEQTVQTIKTPGLEISDIARKLVYLKRVSDSLPSFKTKINTAISDCLKDLKQNTAGFKLIDLINRLEQDEIGASIISEFEIFKGEIIRSLYLKTNRHDITYILDKLEGDSLDTNKLKIRYETYIKEYDKLISQFISYNYLDDLVENIFQLVVEAKALDKQVKRTVVLWNDKFKNKLPNLIAHISALWTLKNKKYYDEAEDSSKKNEYLLKPHPAQIVAIFRMLGIGYGDASNSSFKIISTELDNNLIEVGTGEGKSVILAITACVLGLFEYQVDCACYSEYLSKRDYESFKDLFESLKVNDKIKYGTFNEICENLVNLKFNIRQQVLELVKNNAKQQPIKLNSSIVSLKRILLIDEVDVFFNKDFFGQLYVPAARLTDPTILAALDMIWTNRNSKMTFANLKASAQFKECETKFSNWIDLISEALKDVLADLETYKSKSYEVLNDRIAYKEHDGVSFDVVYGYKTMFAYYHEHDQKRISLKSLEENKYLSINTGCFSYSEIPTNFTNILGVTGTLRTIQSSQREVIKEDYNIMVNTYLPSVYGENKRQFKQESDIVISNKDNFDLKLFDEIIRRLAGTINPDTKRAVFVFFETKESLERFYECDQLHGIKSLVNIIKEETTPKDKENFIREATRSGQITLLTRVFGRGIDFVCRNQALLNNGGVHVIQRFLSEDYSEQVQIMGRTARQGEDGSYSMVLLDEDLEKFLGNGYGDEITRMRNENRVYPTLDKARNDFFDKNNEEIIKAKGSAKAEHDASQKFLDFLEANNIDEIKKFLMNKNQGKMPGNLEKSRTICLMDATGSMSNLLMSAKNTVITMFTRIIEILKDKKLPTDIFELQFAVYRDYDLKEHLLESSGWENDPLNLRKFMDTIQPMGNSSWEEAVEVGLWHVSREASSTSIAQVILIGDAPGKSEADIKRDREKYGGDAYWSTTKLAQPTHYTKEIEKLKQAKIPVYAFYVDQEPDCVANFETIARETGGTSAYLDVNSKAGSDLLTNVICTRILEDISKKNGNINLVDEYNKRYTKSYHK